MSQNDEMQSDKNDLPVNLKASIFHNIEIKVDGSILYTCKLYEEKKEKNDQEVASGKRKRKREIQTQYSIPQKNQSSNVWKHIKVSMLFSKKKKKNNKFFKKIFELVQIEITSIIHY